MDQQGVFTLPPNINFGVVAFANSSIAQSITIAVDGQVKATYKGSGASDVLLGNGVFNSGAGRVQVTVTTGDKQTPSTLLSTQIILADRLNFGLVIGEEGPDGDGNDSVLSLNWPLG
ncbi:fucose-binding lectin II [Paraburkholderia caffeinilytica]|uniref:fucose-binding lectin II n=1 Tax=Paraburkholderia caffeinilytica TaxID=1761016 RepID=UPI003DA0DC98